LKRFLNGILVDDGVAALSVSCPEIAIATACGIPALITFFGLARPVWLLLRFSFLYWNFAGALLLDHFVGGL